MHKHILYLASGSSRRFGANKLLHPLEGKPMYCYGLETLSQVVNARSDCSLTVVSRYAPIREGARALGIAAADSPQSHLGVSHTIRAGLRSLEIREEDYILFVVADQPWLTGRSVVRLLEAGEKGADCACLCWESRPGNPCLFSARLLPELMALEGDTGGRAVLKRHACVYVPADSSKELEDIDTR